MADPVVYLLMIALAGSDKFSKVGSVHQTEKLCLARVAEMEQERDHHHPDDKSSFHCRAWFLWTDADRAPDEKCVGPFAQGFSLFFGVRVPKEKQCR